MESLITPHASEPLPGEPDLRPAGAADRRRGPRPPLAHPRGALREPARDRDRQHDRQRRAPHPRARPRHEHQRAAVGGRRVHARVRRPAAHRRAASATASGARVRSPSASSIFGVASAAAAFAGGVDALIGARAVMGIGAALIMPATLSILTNVFTDARERAHRDRPLVGRRRHGGRARARHRRLPARALLVGIGVHRERADRDRRDRRRPLPRADVAQPASAAARPRRRRARRSSAWSRWSWAIIEAPSDGWTERADPRRLRGRGARARGVRRGGSAASTSRCSTSASSRNPRFTAASVTVTLVFFALVRLHLPGDAVPAVRARLLAVRRPACARCRSRSR